MPDQRFAVHDVKLTPRNDRDGAATDEIAAIQEEELNAGFSLARTEVYSSGASAHLLLFFQHRICIPAGREVSQ